MKILIEYSKFKLCSLNDTWIVLDDCFAGFIVDLKQLYFLVYDIMGMGILWLVDDLNYLDGVCLEEFMWGKI